MIAQILVTRQEEEVRRLETCLCDSVSDPMEAAQFCGLLQAAMQERGRLRAAFDRDFGTPDARADCAAAASLLSAQTNHLTVVAG